LKFKTFPLNNIVSLNAGRAINNNNASNKKKKKEKLFFILINNNKKIVKTEQCDRY